MNIKSRIFGFAAAAILSLSIVSGALAQTSTSTQIELASDPDCGAKITTASVDFGKYTWNGTTYGVNPANSQVTLTVDSAVWPATTCTVNLSASDMVTRDGDDVVIGTIPSAALTFANGPDYLVTPAQAYNVGLILQPDYNTGGFSYNNLTPGIYTGTITVSTESSAG